MLGVIATLLDDGVILFEEDLKQIETWIENDPDLITDIIKVHGFAENNRDTITAEHIFPTETGIVYELISVDIELAMYLTIAIDKLNIRSENLVVCVAYPMEEIDD